MSDLLDQAFGSTAGGVCPVCDVEFRIHDGRSCCLCCGDIFTAAEGGKLEIQRCPIHARDCEHWKAVWEARRDAP